VSRLKVHRERSLWGTGGDMAADKGDAKLKVGNAGLSPEHGGPYRSPPIRDFVFFSESARSVLECLELNAREGIFVGPLKLRPNALAVIEAVGTDEAPCQVRLIGRIESIDQAPYPLIRVSWLRGISKLPPTPFLAAVEVHYGFRLPVPADGLHDADFESGTEYDFVQRLLSPRRIDAARGDGRGPGPVSVDLGGLRRPDLEDVAKLRERVGMTSTIALPRGALDKEE